MDAVAPPQLQARVLPGVAAADRRAWQALELGGNPFLSFDFLAALEGTGCIGRRSGWTPSLVALHDSVGLAAVAPSYLKSHSYGEFVFDFAWAQAYVRYGLPYYPKLVVAVPFTPAGGPRLLVRADLAREPAQRHAVQTQLVHALTEHARSEGCSSVHVLFHDEAERAALPPPQWLARRDCQFHWRNHGYGDFEQFLATFSADKRKKAKRERRRVAEAGVTFETLHGEDCTPALLDRVFALHRETFRNHGHEPYLNRAFFTVAARELGAGFMVKAAMLRGEMIAAAVFFVGGDTLYGRYWGAVAEFHSLHFETCYHQGIEYCIEHGLQHFEPGTQGEHKVSRGFEPTITHSSHWIADSRFRDAIGDFLQREQLAVDDYASSMQEHVPYRDRRGGT